MADSLFRAKERIGALSTTDLKRLGYPIVHCCGPLVLPELHKRGWFITEETKTTEVDCKGWFHCGPSCCGICPFCGDSQAGKRNQTLVAPPERLSRRAAKKLLNKIMSEVLEPSQENDESRA